MKMYVLHQLNINPERHRAVSVVGGGGKTSLIFRLTAELVSMGKRVIVTTTTHMAYEPRRPFADSEDFTTIREHLQKYGYTIAARRNQQEAIGESYAESSKITSPRTECQKISSPRMESLEKLREECDVLLIEADGSKRLPVKVPAEWEPVIPEFADLVIGVIGLDALGQPINQTAHRPELTASFLNKSLTAPITSDDLVKIASSVQALRKNTDKIEYRVYLNKSDLLLAYSSQTLQRNAEKAECRGNLNKLELSVTEKDGVCEIGEKICKQLQKKGIQATHGSLLCPAGISIIILAAGNSKRFGSNKLLHPIEGKPMYIHVLEQTLKVRQLLEQQEQTLKVKQLLEEQEQTLKVKNPLEQQKQTGRGKIVLVTQYDEIQQEAEKYGIQIVRNSHPEEGITSSMKLGLLASLDSEACLFTVADQPWITAATMSDLIYAWLTSGNEKNADKASASSKYRNQEEHPKHTKGIAAVSQNGIPGNPCLFSKEYYPELLHLSGDKGGKQVLNAHPDDTLLLEAQNPKELTDIDKLEDQ